MSDREQFEAARAAGLKARHETRVERAIRRDAEREALDALEGELGSEFYAEVSPPLDVLAAVLAKHGWVYDPEVLVTTLAPAYPNPEALVFWCPLSRQLVDVAHADTCPGFGLHERVNLTAVHASIRRQVAEEIAQAIENNHGWQTPTQQEALDFAAKIARNIGSRETS